MATDYYAEAFGLAEQVMDASSSRADTALSQATQVMSGLSNVQFDFGAAEIPAPPEVQIPEVDVTEPAFDAGDLLAALQDLDIPEFSPPVTPEAAGQPDSIDTGSKPARPEDAMPDFPLAPELTMPLAPEITNPVVPEAATKYVKFSDEAPQQPSPTLPAKYDGGLSDATVTEVKDKLTALWDFANPATEGGLIQSVGAWLTVAIKGDAEGKRGTGLPAYIEQALFDRAAEREDATALKAEQAAVDAFAGRGFMMPPGMLAEALDVAEQHSRLAKNDLSREVLTKAATWELENLRLAVTQGIALEGQMMQHTLGMVAQVLDLGFKAKEWELTLWRAEWEQYQWVWGVYKDRFELWRQDLVMQIEDLKQQLENAKTVAAMQTVKMQVFLAQVEYVTKQVDLYKTQTDAATAKIGAIKAKLEAWGTDIGAWAKDIDAQIAYKVNAWQTKVQGNAAMMDAYTRGFAATLEGQRTTGNIRVGNLQAKIGALDVAVRKYAAQVDFQTKRADIQIRGPEAQAQVNVGLYNAQVHQFLGLREQILGQVKVLQESIQAAGHMAAQLASGAMAAQHVSVSAAGSAHVGSSESQSTSTSYNYDMASV